MQAPAGEGPAGLGDTRTGTGGQSMAHDASTLGTAAAGEPGPRQDKASPEVPSRDMRR